MRARFPDPRAHEAGYAPRAVSVRFAKASALVLGLVVAVAPYALAQPRGRGRSKPQPPPAASTLSKATAAADAGEPPADAGASAQAEPPALESDATDGGVRSSPLNPRAEELPSLTPDGGAPPDYDRILADVAALRARVSTVANAFYKARVAVTLRLDADHAKITRLVVSLDDGVVFTAQKGFQADEARPVYERAVAPGKHTVTVDIDRQDERDATFVTSQRTRFVVDVPRDHRVDAHVRIEDDSTMGRDFPGDRSGRYDLRVRVRAAASPVGR